MDIGQAVVVGVLIELHWSLHDEIQRREMIPWQAATTIV